MSDIPSQPDPDGNASAVPTGHALDARDPNFRDQPHSALDKLRDVEPVHVDRSLDRVVLTCAAEVSSVLNDRTLSSNPYRARPTSFGRRGLKPSEEPFRSFVFMDDPEHARLRGLVARAFDHRTIEELRPRIETIAVELLAKITPTPSFDLVRTFALPLPMIVIAELIGVPKVDVALFHAWSQSLLIAVSPERTDQQQRELSEALEGLSACLARLVAERRATPRDDLIGRLVAADTAGDRLTEDEIINICRLLLSAGNNTTADLIGNGVVALMRHPEQLKCFLADTGVAAAMVEEVLRFDPPVVAWNRHALSELQISGCPVEAGQTVTSMLIAANHDPAVHAEPHRFNIGRAGQRHWSFGGGAHFCLGAPLARAEAQIGLQALFDRFPDLTLDPERPPQRKAHPGFNGYASIYVHTR